MEFLEGRVILIVGIICGGEFGEIRQGGHWGRAGCFPFVLKRLRLYYWYLLSIFSNFLILLRQLLAIFKICQ